MARGLAIVHADCCSADDEGLLSFDELDGSVGLCGLFDLPIRRDQLLIGDSSPLLERYRTRVVDF